MNSSTRSPLALASFAFALCVGGPSAAGPLLLTSGVACQPATAADAKALDYSDGTARNASAGARIQVVCPLPPVAPGHVAVLARVSLLDFNENWGGRCIFRNLWPGLPGLAVPTAGLPASPWLGEAEMHIGEAKFVPHSVACTLLPGQALYGVTLDLDVP